MTKQKLASKNRTKDETRHAAVALAKKKKKQDEAKTRADAPPLPPPMEAPPGTDEPGEFRVVRHGRHEPFWSTKHCHGHWEP